MKTFLVKHILAAHCQRWLKGLWENSPPEAREQFLNDETDLSAYHHTIGRAMRNDCRLWEFAAHLEEHPDDFSHRMLVKFRGRLNEPKLTVSMLPKVQS
ncbi:hypothetical protein VPHF86_0282 [Vibrio phage F86]